MQTMSGKVVSQAPNTALTDAMRTIHTISELRTELAHYRLAGKSIALVPTMGNLHDGHISLVTQAKTLADVTVCSIFVNPMQFGAGEDLDAYPRTLEQDSQRLTSAGCDILFAPSVAEVYPEGLQEQTVVHVPGISARHCGASRPGHFDGVATVVSKLFHMVQPNHALFGLKDYQQFQVIRKMVSDQCFDITLHGIPTVRDQHGLALSSRNGYLTSAQIDIARHLYQQLSRVAKALKQGNSHFEKLEKDSYQYWQSLGIRMDYFQICHHQTLQPMTELTTQEQAATRHYVLLVAAYVGNTRLIDNLVVSRPE